jgi:hypothetical protein
VSAELDGSVRIAWQAAGFEQIQVIAPRRTRGELDAFAREVADLALFNRSVDDLRVALRASFGADVSLAERATRGGALRLAVTLQPPPGMPNPDE